MIAKTESMPRKRSTEKTETIRVTEKVARMIEVITTAEGASSSEVASPILEKMLKERYLKAARKIGNEPEELGFA